MCSEINSKITSMFFLYRLFQLKFSKYSLYLSFIWKKFNFFFQSLWWKLCPTFIIFAQQYCCFCGARILSQKKISKNFMWFQSTWKKIHFPCLNNIIKLICYHFAGLSKIKLIKRTLHCRLAKMAPFYYIKVSNGVTSTSSKY